MSQKKTVQKRTVLDADMGSMDLLPLFNRRAGIVDKKPGIPRKYGISGLYFCLRDTFLIPVFQIRVSISLLEPSPQDQKAFQSVPRSGGPSLDKDAHRCSMWSARSHGQGAPRSA